MFTGLVEGRGIVADILPEGAAIRVVIDVPESLAGPCRIGESVALNGCCLTVVEVQRRRWAFQAGEETLAKTNLKSLTVGAPVNLERPLPADGRLGGHFVQGHIDGVGRVAAVERDGEWMTMWIRVPHRLAEGTVEKGSVAVDGVSLTVVRVDGDQFSVALIPHTLQSTTLGVRDVGDDVNIETDILGKYVRKMIGTG